jgi:hypothetical protein
MNAMAVVNTMVAAMLSFMQPGPATDIVVGLPSLIGYEIIGPAGMGGMFFIAIRIVDR